MSRRAERLPALGLALALLAALLLTGVRAVAQDGALRLSDQFEREITLPVAQSRVFTTARDVERLVLGDPAIADVVLTSPRSFYVLGKSLGRTNLQVFTEGDYPSAVVDLEVTVDLDDLRTALRRAAPNADIRVEAVNGRLRLYGNVPDAVVLDRVLEIAGQYGSETVINAIQVSSPQQVFLEVRMIEATRDAGRSLGIRLQAADTDGDGRFSAGGGRGTTAPPLGTLIGSLIDDGVRLDLLVQALEEKGLARNLAEPTLAALSGETASFLAGGEVPIPVAEEDGKVTVEYKEFGVRLGFRPIVLNNGLINLTLEPEVSQIDLTTTFDTGTVRLPSFSTRRASTTVELRDGQSFAIAGLLQRNNLRQQAQVPWLGDVPILGALFRSSSFQKEETDLVIIVTPHLSRPAARGVRLATPLDRAVLTSEREFFLYGRAEITRDELRQRLSRRGIDGPFGHIIDQDVYIPEPDHVGK